MDTDDLPTEQIDDDEFFQGTACAGIVTTFAIYAVIILAVALFMMALP